MSIKRFFLFFVSKTFWINILVMVIVAVFLFVGALQWLGYYTDHGQSIRVPDVTGLTITESLVQINGKGLRYEIVDSVYRDMVKPGIILDQIPKPGQAVKQNRKIFLTINTATPLQIVIPNVRDVSQRQAVALLQGSGFKIAQIKYVPSEYSDLVIDMLYKDKSIPLGTKLPLKTSIVLTVGKGSSNETVTVPSLRAYTLSESANILREYKLTIGGVFFETEPIDEADKVKYVVYKQVPPAHEVTTAGKAIELFLTKEKDRVKKEEEKDVNNNAVKIEDSDESWF